MTTGGQREVSIVRKRCYHNDGSVDSGANIDDSGAVVMRRINKKDEAVRGDGGFRHPYIVWGTLPHVRGRPNSCRDFPAHLLHGQKDLQLIQYPISPPRI